MYAGVGHTHTHTGLRILAGVFPAHIYMYAGVGVLLGFHRVFVSAAITFLGYLIGFLGAFITLLTQTNCTAARSLFFFLPGFLF
jgi:hypothetical protein